MNTLICRLVLALLLPLVIPCPTAHAQGALTPPGVPAAGMKTLDQIYAKLDARIPITNSAGLVTISQAGSYYLTTNLTVSSGDAIDIAANGVTLDLNGFTLSSSAASATGNAIYLASAVANTDITIRNGHIVGGVTNNAGTYAGPGFTNGITSNPAGKTDNIHVSLVSVSGCSGNGLFLPLASGNSPGYSTTVESCNVKAIGGTGIQATTVARSTAVDCGNIGINCSSAMESRGEATGAYAIGLSAFTAENCFGSSLATNGGYGLLATTVNNCQGNASGTNSYAILANGSANNCYGYCTGTNGNGIYAPVASNCRGFSTTGTGLYIYGSATGCYGASTYGTGIRATVANACVVGSGTTNITYKYNMP